MYEYQVNESPYSSLLAGTFGIIFLVVSLALAILTIAGFWKMFVKAGRPGWAAVVPLYNWWVWVDIIGRPRWWFWAALASVLLSWIPLVGVVISLVAAVLYLLGCLDMAKLFGKGAGTGIGLWLLSFIFAPLLGFGSAEFQGGGRATSAGAWGAGFGGSDEASAYDQSPYDASPYAAPAVAAPSVQAPSSPGQWQTSAGAPQSAATPAAGPGRSASGISSAASSEAAPAARPQATLPPQAAPAAGFRAAMAPSWPPSEEGARPAYTMAPPTAPVPPLGSRMPGQPA